MGAHVVEGAQLRLAIADDEHRFAGEIAHEVVARRGNLVGPSDADPVPKKSRSRSSSWTAALE